MNRYAVFAGDYYYPAGGWSDLQDIFPTKEDAIKDADRRVATTPMDLGGYTYLRSENDWVQVVDLEVGVIVYNCQKEGR